MKLYWSSRSPFVRKVMVFAHEAGLAGRFETVRTLVGMNQANAELMQFNPLGKIPTLVTDDGRVLFDSYVICEYLNGLNPGSKLIPASGTERLQALRWHALGDNMLDNLLLWRNEQMRPASKQSPEILAALDAKIRASLDFLEREAATLGAAAVGIGQVAVAVALGYLDFRFPQLAWRDGHAKLAAWHEAFARRPSYQATLPVDA